jgi:putative cardiolipin synthase
MFDFMVGIRESMYNRSSTLRLSKTAIIGLPALLRGLLPLYLLLAGCATTLPTDFTRTPSIALADPEKTELGRFFRPELETHAGDSGAVLIISGRGGFRARVGLANVAEKTLDLQYFVWENDTVGKVIAERVLRAADRGVRVRLLIDDNGTEDTEFGFAQMDIHPNIEIRLFNPFAGRESRLFQFVADFDRLNHRMHNKAIIADNAAAIVGGRNIGNAYYGIDAAANFRDADIGLVGPVVHQLSRGFDLYWNSEQAIPIGALVEHGLSAQEFKDRKNQLYRWVANLDDFPYEIDRSKDEMLVRLQALRDRIVWAPVKVIYDPPDKLKTRDEVVRDKILDVGQEREREVVVEAAYFIPGELLLSRARDSQEKGVRVRVLTNSLATNDVDAAHAGYARYREQMLRYGVEIYELRPDAGARQPRWWLMAGRSKASLHTKVLVFDRRKVVIGSFNLDPRSASINTEVVVVIDSAEFAAQLLAYMETGIQLKNSYHLILESDKSGTEQLVWITENDGNEVRYYSDPEVGLWRRFTTWLVSLLPIEHLL